jgi:peptide/nickel transport system permease protein
LSSRTRIGAALIVLGMLHGAILAAGFLAPYAPDAQSRDFPFAPPTRIHFIDRAGRLHLRPFVHGLAVRTGSPGTYDEDESIAYPVRFFLKADGVGGTIARPARHLFGVERPGRIFLFGTDGFGRDQFSRLLFGGRISLFSGLLAAALSLGLGLVLGSLAGFYGGWIDDIIMRGAELFLALPWLYCLLVLRAFLPLSVSAGQIFLLLVVVIGLRGWARPARMIRGVVLTAKERDYVLAARGFGASGPYLLARHILPETFGILLTQAALLIPQFIMGEVTLSFLGLGVGEPSPSWGNMLASLQHYYVLASYWWMCLPGLILIPVFLAYYVLAGALQERLHVGGPIRLMGSSQAGAVE